ncbi:hypothetical protein wTpre_1039 [Wolbachia endosymbiont of Trichogramma pretiosum]|nr:hypothetical protein wTpre_1039 [Wolbachia endosymbiont of Trichogramma pretiosum]
MLVSTLSIYIIKTRYIGILLPFFYLVNLLIFIAKASEQHLMLKSLL